jgi:hypothetical protein
MRLNGLAELTWVALKLFDVTVDPIEFENRILGGALKSH